MSTEEYEFTKLDVKTEFEKYGRVVNMFVVSRRSYVRIGVELGTIFVEFDDSKYSEMAYYGLNKKKYKNKELQISFIKREVFYDEILPESKKKQVLESTVIVENKKTEGNTNHNNQESSSIQKDNENKGVEIDMTLD